MAYNPNSYFNYEAGRGSIYSSPPKSKPKNANEQAAKSMGSAGIGGLGGRPTTTAAQKIQDNFRRETQKDSGSTYDEIALPTEEKVDKEVKGLGAPDKPDEDKDQSPLEKLKSTFDSVAEMMGLGKPEKPKKAAYTPDKIYSTAAFRARASSRNPIDIDAQNRRIDYAVDFKNAVPMAYLPAGGTYDEITKQRGADERNQKQMAESINDTIAQLYAPDDPARQFYQSNVPMDQRIFEPELEYDKETHTVKKGDTLSEIAQDNGTTVEELVRLNDIEDKELIYTGDELKIPSTKSTKTKEDIVSSLIQGYERKKDMSGTQVASSGEIMSDAYDPDAQYYESFRQGITPEVKQELPFITSSDTTKGKRERIAYGEAYKNGLRGEELQSFMAQLAHESAKYGAMKEKGYSLSRAKQVGGKAWKERLERDNVFDPSDRNAKNTGPIQAPTSENIFNSVYANRNGNGDFSSGDGNRYKGRGYIQLTGRGQYRTIGNTIGVDLENNPELMEDPVIAAKASVAYWKENVRGNVPADDYSNTKAVSGIINRGSADKIASGLSDRKKLFNRYGQKITTTSTSLRPKARPLGRP